MPSRKQQMTPEETDVWGATPAVPNPPAESDSVESAPIPEAAPIRTPSKSNDFDIDGLMTDFPTATDLERFVFDQTGVVLSLKGRANKLKYQVAMDVLNGDEVDAKFIGGENPYVDRADMVPVEELREAPARDASIPGREHMQNSFHSRQIPHPDPDFRAQGRRCDVTFRKYDNGMITYEVLGPIDQRAVGEKLDKFGRTRPEIIKWIDPRSGEQVVQRADGTLTPMGKRLRALMQLKKVNNTNFWDVWIDREFVTMNSNVMSNPWATEQ
jgi:hypothetical protein